MSQKKRRYESWCKDVAAQVTNYGTINAGNCAYDPIEFIQIVEKHPVNSLLCRVGKQLPAVSFNSFQIAFYEKRPKITEHTDGNQLHARSSIVTWLPFNSSLIRFSNQTQKKKAEDCIHFSAKLPPFCIYGFVYDDRTHLGGHIAPFQLFHERRDTYIEFENQPSYSLILRHMLPQKKIESLERRYLLENNLLKKFDNKCKGQTRIGRICAPATDTIHYVVATQINQLILTDFTPGEYFEPGSEFINNTLGLRMLSLHNQVQKCFCYLGNCIVSVHLTNIEKSTIKFSNSDAEEVFIARAAYLTEDMLTTTKKGGNIIWVFVSPAFAVTCQFQNSILYLGNFILTGYNNEEVVLRNCSFDI